MIAASYRGAMFLLRSKKPKRTLLKVSGFKGVSSTGILTFLRKLGGAATVPQCLAQL
jgi:hypothetical protein